MLGFLSRNLAMAANVQNSMLRSKFKGSLLGALMGDCFGAPFEGDTTSAGDRVTIQKYFDKLEDPSLKAPYRPYTDDTAMMKSIAKFLIDKPEPDFNHLAKLFVKEYYDSPNRGYGANVVDVFQKLRNSKFDDVFKPARKQFNGSGSYGNGGAMRVAPIALYFYNNYDLMIDTAKKATEITHTNKLGVNGALLQCIAVNQALLMDPAKEMDAQKFCDDLWAKMAQFEKVDETDIIDDIGTPYQDKIRTIQHFLKKKFNDEFDEEVIFELGNSISAYHSVPTAIFCFLRSLTGIPTVKTNNVLRRTMQYAITLGGDTDTIACMAGAIAGAYLGDSAVNPEVVKHCEYSKEMAEMAEKLFEASGAVNEVSAQQS